MYGYRFYEEYENKPKGVSAGNVVAVNCVDPAFWSGDGMAREAMGAVLFSPNSPVGSTSVSQKYLRTKCKRVSEHAARAIHPTLFGVLDSWK